MEIYLRPLRLTLSPLLACKPTNTVYGYGCLSHSSMKESQNFLQLSRLTYFKSAPNFQILFVNLWNSYCIKRHKNSNLNLTNRFPLMNQNHCLKQIQTLITLTEKTLMEKFTFCEAQTHNFFLSYFSVLQIKLQIHLAAAYSERIYIGAFL